MLIKGAKPVDRIDCRYNLLQAKAPSDRERHERLDDWRGISQARGFDDYPIERANFAFGTLDLKFA